MVDPSFSEEWQAAIGAGFRTQIVSFEALVCGGAEHAVFRLSETSTTTPVFYRGWMLTELQYFAFERALAKRNYRLFTTSRAYAQAHYFPQAYELIRDHTAQTVWTEGRDLDVAWKAIHPLQPGPMVVKDWVKSEKGYWDTACFVPDSSNRVAFEAVCKEFTKIRGESFERGFVFRRFIEFKRRPTGRIDERRLFFFDGHCLVGDRAVLDTAPFVINVARSFASKFLTIDVAKMSDDTWMVVETGDGGVSAIPDDVEPRDFYSSLAYLLQTRSAVTPWKK